MAKTRNNENVIAITKLRLEIDEFVYPVTSVNISLGQNWIPTIELSIAPERALSSDVTEDIPKVAQSTAPPTLTRFMRHHRFLQSLALQEDVVTRFQLQIVQENTGEVQEIDIDNWVFAGGGVGQIDASGSFSLNVTLKHPVCRTDRASIAVANHANSEDTPGVLSGFYTDLVDTYSSIIREYAESAGDPVKDSDRPVIVTSDNFDFEEDCESSLDTVSEILTEKLIEALDIFDQTVDWFSASNSEDFPFAGDEELRQAFSLNNSEAEYFAKTMWDIIGTHGLPGQGGTLWQTFVGNVISQYELTATGAPSNAPIQVYPFAPWGEAVGQIRDTEISGLAQPPHDNFPVAGIIANYDLAAERDLLSMYDSATSDGSAGGEDIVTGIAGFVCPLINGMVGSVRYMTPPPWLQYLPRYKSTDHDNVADHQMNRKRYNRDASLTFQSTQGAGNTQSDPETFKALRAAATLWSEQAFLRTYRSGVNIGLSTRLKIQDDLMNLPDGYIRPGVSYAIVSEDENGNDQVIMYFYCTSVQHTIDAGNSVASTSFNGAYVRTPVDFPQAGITADKIAEGLTNPLYGANGRVILDG